MVNGAAITRQDVDKAYRRTRDAGATASEEEAVMAKMQLLDDLILQELMLAKATDDFVHSRDIDVREYVEIDEAAIQAKVESDLRADIDRAIAEDTEPIPTVAPAARDPVAASIDRRETIEKHLAIRAY